MKSKIHKIRLQSVAFSFDAKKHVILPVTMTTWEQKKTKKTKDSNEKQVFENNYLKSYENLSAVKQCMKKCIKNLKYIFLFHQGSHWELPLHTFCQRIKERTPNTEKTQAFFCEHPLLKQLEP